MNKNRQLKPFENHGDSAENSMENTENEVEGYM